jgi:AraC-like DNA-binding protein
MNEVFTTIGATFCLFLLVLIKSKKKSALGDNWLVLWLAVHCAYFISFGLTSVLPSSTLYVAVLVSQISFLALPPIQYFHARAASNRSVVAVLWEGSLVLAIFLALIVVPLIMPSEIIAGSLTVRNPSLFVLPLLILLVPFYYPLRGFQVIQSHRRALKQRLSNLNKADLTWATNWAFSTMALSVGSLILMAATFVIEIPIPVRSGIVLFLQALQIGIVGYLGLTRSRVFILSRAADELELPEGKSEYEDAATDFATLQAFQASDQSYLDAELTAGALADRIGWAPDRLSRALRLGGATNFYDFVNGARIEAFKEMALDPKNKRTNMLYLAYDAGFGSKSAFYDVFRVSENLPPARWRRQAMQD